MPRFFTHVTDNGEYAEDPEGQDLPDLKAVKRAAFKGAIGLIMARFQSGAYDVSLQFTVTDSQGEHLDSFDVIAHVRGLPDGEIGPEIDPYE